MIRKTVLTAICLIFLTGIAGAVVNHSANDTDGDVHIMNSGPSAGSSTVVGPEGQEWTVTVEQRNASCTAGKNHSTLTDVVFSGESSDNGGYTALFTGHLQTPDPCHTVDHEVEKIGDNRYELRVSSVDSGGICVECVGALTYGASFEAQEPFELTVIHDGETVDTVIHPQYEDDGETRNFGLDGVMQLLLGLLPF